MDTALHKKITVLSFYIAIRRHDPNIVGKMIEQYPFVLNEKIPQIILSDTYYPIKLNHPYYDDEIFTGYSKKMKKTVADNVLDYAVHFNTFEIFQILMVHGAISNMGSYLENIKEMHLVEKLYHSEYGLSHHAFTNSLPYSEYLCNRGVHVTLNDIKYKIDHHINDIYFISFIIRKYLQQSPISLDIFEIFDIVNNKYTFNKSITLKIQGHHLSRNIDTMFKYMPVPSLQHIVLCQINQTID